MSAMKYKVRFDENCFSRLRDEQMEVGSSERSLNIRLSDDQDIAYRNIKDWIRTKSKPYFVFSGFGGTGKSTLISVLASDFYQKRIVFCSLTGKATGVLRKKFRDAGIESPRHIVLTIHSFLYQCFVHDCKSHAPLPAGKVCEEAGKLCWAMKAATDDVAPELIVVDESSMITKVIKRDLLSLGIPILFVGDRGQLPAVGDNADIMAHPDASLETIHRQAMGNPILELSAMIRNDGRLPQVLPGNGDGRLRYIGRSDFERAMGIVYKQALAGKTPGLTSMADVAVLCWMNHTRCRTNRELRKLYFEAIDRSPSGLATERASGDDSPRAGDQVICLKNAFRLAFNGMRGALSLVHPETAQSSRHHYEVVADFEEDNLRFRGSANRYLFGREKGIESLNDFAKEGLIAREWSDLGFQLDYGYCMTTHKAQGSQFHTAVVIPERPMSASSDVVRRHLYTSVTRAAERLLIIV